MKAEIVKPKKEEKETKSVKEAGNIITPIIYLVLGLLLIFKNEKVMEFFFYVVGIIIIIYGIKSFVVYYQNKELVRYKNINLSIAIVSVIIGVLLILLSGALQAFVQYTIGFIFIFIGLSRLLVSISFNNYKSLSTLINIALIIFGVCSMFSNLILIGLGIILVINSILLFIEYFR